ncbi:putative lipid II flippase FtsW [Streptomyces sp. N2-109]|uniref:Probable peptidoglycan glycosyltransferase FtsW n=1 Tax=Streptomyces gossypii TaxID=2883101 RepID=A0ABT2JZN9_9ACTN|nr:putative lipid II flippase FtsW [Streptomyces gossypii]MCT2593382.1 putative lipid II flippase FtsW [Streptomyces gossypii]
MPALLRGARRAAATAVTGATAATAALTGPAPAVAGGALPGGVLARTRGDGDRAAPRTSGRPRPAAERNGRTPRARTGRTPAVPAAPAPRRPPKRPPGRERAGGLLGRSLTRARRAWDRPLTAYYVILGGSLLLTALGLVMVFSASQIQALQSGLSSTYFFQKQLVAAVLGAVLLLIASRMPVRLHRAFAYPLLAGSVFLLCLVQVPGVGRSVNGNQNWIHLGGPFQLQPSEFAKLALVLWGADLLARKGDKRMLTQWKHMLVPLIPVAFLLLGLIMLGGDMGTAMILTAIVFGLLWLLGAPTRLFAGVLAAAVTIGALLVVSSPNRMARLECLGATDPGPSDQCWQAVHGIYALASGGWFGSGLGASVEKWGQLPEPHTDFIFAVTGEELGLAGTLSVLALFAALGYAGIRVAGRTEDPFVRYAAGGVTTWITAQAAINIGAVLGLLPIAGVPLPLFSYGGSALLPTMFAIGLLIAFARGDPAARTALARRQPVLFGKVGKSGKTGEPSKPGKAGRSAEAGGGRAGVRWMTMRRRADRRPSGER